MEHFAYVFSILWAAQWVNWSRTVGNKLDYYALLVGKVCFPTIALLLCGIFPTGVVPRGTMLDSDKYQHCAATVPLAPSLIPPGACSQDIS